jgi:hypothetical protein
LIWPASLVGGADVQDDATRAWNFCTAIYYKAGGANSSSRNASTVEEAEQRLTSGKRRDLTPHAVRAFGTIGV